MAYSKEYIKNLELWAIEYIEECSSHKKETLSNKGEIIRTISWSFRSVVDVRF